MILKRLFVGLALTALMASGRAQDVAGQIEDNDTTPYHVALLDYKLGKYQEAYDVLARGAQAIAPSNLPQYYILESKVLTELKRYDEGEKLLHGILTPTGPVEVQVALGDLFLRKHSFDRAEKYYGLALQAKPNDPNITMKLVYAEVGVSDFVDAGKYASQLKPLDPDVPCYYFAKAAIAQATSKAQEADDDIQTARTIYGITVANHYLKTYLEVVSSPEKGSASDITTPPSAKPPPSG